MNATITLETARGGYTYMFFKYSVSGNKIICKGASSSTIGDGYVNENSTHEFKLEGNRLYPIEYWTMFILTQDGSIETDINGNIIKE